MDSQHPETEKELETFYMNFAQPNALTMKQCLMLALHVVKDGAFGLGGWNGESARVSKLHVRAHAAWSAAALPNHYQIMRERIYELGLSFSYCWLV